MKIYDELTHDIMDPEEVSSLVKNGKGRTYEGQIQVGTVPGIPEHLYHINGTETSQNPKGSDRIVPAVPEKPIFENCIYYHSFTPEELAPTWQETIEAQVLYTSLMTDTLLEE